MTEIAPDPERSLIHDEGINIEFNVNELGKTGYIPLIRFAQILVAQLEQLNLARDWRQTIYRETDDNSTDHNHLGTGSQEEKEALSGMAVVAKVLKLRNG